MKDVLDDIDAWTARGDKVAHRHGRRRQALGAAPAGREDGRQRARRGLRRRVAAAASRAPSSRSPRRCCAGGAPQLLHFGIADEEAWDVGLPCGGEIDVWVERYEP